MLRIVAGATVIFGLTIAPAAAQGNPPGEDDAAATQTWSVQPAGDEGADGRPNWHYELEPGETVDDVAQVNNFSAEVVTFRVYSHDAINTPEGGFTLQPADVEPTGIGAWIGLDEEITVEPGGSALVPFTLTVPDDATPGDHTGGIIASITTEATDAQGQRVLVDSRAGSRVYLRVAGEVNPALAVTGLEAGYERSWVPFSTGDVTVTYRVENVGNVRLSGEQRITGHGLFGFGEHTATLADVEELLPGQAITVTTRIENVAPLLRITEEVTVNPRPPRTTPAEALPTVLATAAVSVWAVPWPELIIVGLLVLGIAWSWWRRRQQKQQTAAMLAEAVARAREETRRELQQSAATTENPESSSGDGDSPKDKKTSAPPTM